VGIRLIDPSLPASELMSHCTSLETKITFNQQGPAGADGKDGAPGANGKDGVSPTVTQLSPDDTNCSAGGAAITDAAGHTALVCNGTDGKDGQPFSGTFKSPNGLFSVSVTDQGIKLQGPGGTISLSGGNVAVNSGLIALNPTGCAPAARVGDPVTVNGFASPMGGPVLSQGTLGPIGSNTVCIGP
jgi:hypothetical protein